MVYYKIRRKTVRWVQAALIDSAQAQKIVDYEEAALRRGVRAALGYFILAGALLGFGALYFRADISQGAGASWVSVLDIACAVLFSWAVFLDILKHHSGLSANLSKAALNKVNFKAIPILAATTLALGGVMFVRQADPIHSLSAWLVAVAASVLFAFQRSRAAASLLFVYIATGYVLELQFQNSMWKSEYQVFAGVVGAGTLLVALNYCWKLVTVIFRLIGSSQIGAGLAYLASQWVKMNEYLGPYRKWLFILAGATLLISSVRVMVSGVIALLVLGSLLWKEKPRFSVLFCLGAWVVIGFQLRLWNLGQTAGAVPAGRLTLGVAVLATFLLSGKLYAGLKAPARDLIPLGPVGYITFLALILTL